jgi:hypothetical protein
MNRLPSRRHLGRFTPKVEALEDRSLLNATVAGTSIITTAAVNQVLITDDGTTIRVFTDNSPAAPLATFTEGTPITVTTNKTGSTNSVTFELLGTQTSIVDANLAVNFGKGNGSLAVGTVSSLPTSLGGNSGGQSFLPGLSNVNITATSGGGNTTVGLFVGDIGASAKLQLNDTGAGKGSNTFVVQLVGHQNIGSSVGLAFKGGDGANSASVYDTEDMVQGSTMNLDLGGKKGTDFFRVLYSGVLLGNLMVTANGGPGNDTISMAFELKSGSNSGSLTAAANGGKGDDNLTEIVHKLGGDTTTVTATADGGVDGPLAKSTDRGSFTQTTATTAGVVFSNFLPANVAFVS